MENFSTDIQFCARCGLDHLGLHFYKFAQPAGHDTHWTPCPQTGEPILLRLAGSAESATYTAKQVPFEHDGRNFVAEIEVAPVRKSNNGETDIFVFKIMDAGVFEGGKLLCKGNGWNNFAVSFDIPK